MIVKEEIYIIEEIPYSLIFEIIDESNFFKDIKNKVMLRFLNKAEINVTYKITFTRQMRDLGHAKLIKDAIENLGYDVHLKINNNSGYILSVSDSYNNLEHAFRKLIEIRNKNIEIDKGLEEFDSSYSDLLKYYYLNTLYLLIEADYEITNYDNKKYNIQIQYKPIAQAHTCIVTLPEHELKMRNINSNNSKSYTVKFSKAIYSINKYDEVAALRNALLLLVNKVNCINGKTSCRIQPYATFDNLDKALLMLCLLKHEVFEFYAKRYEQGIHQDKYGAYSIWNQIQINVLNTRESRLINFSDIF